MTELIPLFPLGAVLYPGLVLPLHIFEDRYRVLVAELVRRPDGDPRAFGVVAIRAGREVGPDGVLALHDIGCTALLRSVEQYEDGRYDIVSSGARRFRLIAIDESQPYLQGSVEWLEESRGGDASVLARSVAESFAHYRAELGAAQGFSVDQDDGDGSGVPADPTALSYVVAASMVLDLSDQQALLAEPDTSGRLRRELSLLRREAAVLRELPSLPAVDYHRQPVSPN